MSVLDRAIAAAVVAATAAFPAVASAVPAPVRTAPTLATGAPHVVLAGHKLRNLAIVGGAAVVGHHVWKKHKQHEAEKRMQKPSGTR